jgi:hypothetical protein
MGSDFRPQRTVATEWDLSCSALSSRAEARNSTVSGGNSPMADHNPEAERNISLVDEYNTLAEVPHKHTPLNRHNSRAEVHHKRISVRHHNSREDQLRR